MATINGTSVGGMTLQIEYSYTQNTTANTTTVTAKLQLVSHYALYATALSGSYISVGGNRTNYSTSISYGGSGTTTTVLATKTVAVSHNSNGTASCNLSGAFVMNGTYRGYSVGTMTVSSTITLPTIPRASGLTVPTSVNTGSALSGTVSPSSTAFNHKVILKTGSTVRNTISLAAGTTTFSDVVEHSWFPSSTSGTVAVVLETYSGTTLIATTTKNVTANVPASVVPSVSALTATSSVTSGTFANLFVQGKTTVRLTVTAAAGSGASIASYTYTGPGVNTTNTSNTYTTPTIQTSGTLTYTVSVKDSRGRTASRNVSITAYAYSAPAMGAVSVQRCDANGNLSDSGTYAKYTVNSTYSTVNGKNTRTVTVAYSSNNGTSYSSATTLQAATDTNSSKTGTYGSGAFAIANTYLLKFTITDAYGATSFTTAQLMSAQRPINIRANGKGVAIGGMSTKDAFECSMDADFNNNVNIDGTINIAGVTTMNSGIVAKGHIYMGGNNGQTGELQVKFSNPTTSQYPHNAYLYGGNPTSTTAIGLYDAKNSRTIMSYNDGDNRINFGSGASISFNNNVLANLVVEDGSQGDWGYRKWSNGRVECWRTVSVNPTNLNNGVNTISMDLPFTFAGTDYNVQITAAKAGHYISGVADCNASGTVTHSTTAFTICYRYNYSTAYTVNFNITVSGRWK